jgi:hypothetical protein
MQTDLQSLRDKADIRIVFFGNTFTIATATYRIGEALFVGEGVARRSCTESYNENEAKDVCVGRAVKALRRKIVWGDRRPIHHKFMG